MKGKQLKSGLLQAVEDKRLRRKIVEGGAEKSHAKPLRREEEVKEFKVGDKVRFLVELGQGPTDETPAFLFARKGETGTVFKVEAAFGFDMSVDSESNPGKPFKVKFSEVELLSDLASSREINSES